MLGKVFIVALVAAFVASIAASAARGTRAGSVVLSSATTELMPGVTYTREVDMTAAGPVVLDIVTAPKPDGTVYSLAPVLSSGALGRPAKLTTMEKSLYAGATTIGLDGDYVKTGGEPNSILIQAGALENEPNAGRTSLGIAADGTLAAAQVSYYGTWQSTAGSPKLRLNSRKGRFTLYTPAYGTSTPSESEDVAEAVFSSFPPAQTSQNLHGTVSQITLAGGTPIPPGGAVLVARGANSVTQLQTQAPVGQQVTVRLTLTPDWSGLVGAIGGGPLLVRNGKAIFSNGETFRPGFLQSRSARGAAGQLADGSIVLVTVESATPAYSVGLSSYDLARELVKLGAVTAVALGSGPAAGMAFNGSLLTRPATGVEPRISDALVLSYTGVYASPIAPVLSPNGDRVGDTEALSYRLVRPATVTATLAGPNGATVPLENKHEPVGVHTFTWDGKLSGVPQPEGAWTFTVSAKDDRKLTTTAQRTFALDKTLGSLTVATTSGGFPVARFVLSRQADVVVRVERRNGVAVATIRRPNLAAGAHRVRWSRKRAGKYLMRVEATSTIGTSSLVVPFSLR